MEQNQIVTIRISKYLTNELARKIAMAQWRSSSPEWVNRIRERTYCDDYFYDNFCVVAENPNKDVIGRLYCVQNEKDKALWCYSDLFVISKYRRMGIAKQMLDEAVNYLRDHHAERLRCYVEPDNTPSIHLQRSAGFSEKAFEKFNLFENCGQIMFELDISCPYSAIPATADEARSVTILYRQSEKELHGAHISLNEFRQALSAKDTDEQNFLVCMGCMPVAWFCVEGLQNKDMAWLSMLAVSDKHRHRGIGTFAVQWAEQFAREKGFTRIGVNLTEDNIPAQNLYRKCGYSTDKSKKCAVRNGTQNSCTLTKVL